MTVDYDKPRNADVDEIQEDSLDDLKTRRNVAPAAIDTDESDSPESFELPDLDISAADELLLVRVLPKQRDEFTCSSCFLVHHRSRLASDKDGRLICSECA